MTPLTTTRAHIWAAAAVSDTRAWLSRRLTLALAALALLGGGIAAPVARAQLGNTVIRTFNGVPSGTCANIQIAVNLLNGDLYDCLTGGWHLVSGAGGAGTFDLIGSGVNTSATMTLGTGGTLTFSGSGINNASAIRGVSITGTPGAGQIPISSSSTAAAWGDPIIQGTQAVGSTTIPNPLVSGGSDYGGTPAIRTWKVDSTGSGHLTIDNASAIMGNCGATTVNAHQYCGNNTASNGVAPGFVVPVLSDIASSSSANNYTMSGNNTHSGIETFKNIDNIIFVDGINYANCSAAAAAIGSVNKTILVIPSNAAASDCGTVTENITVFNYKGDVDQCNVLNSTPPCTAVTFNNDDTVVYAAEKYEMLTNHQDANGITLALYAITTLKNATANGTSGIDGTSSEANSAGTLSGTFSTLQAHEADVTVRSTGGTITTATAGVFYYNSDTGATTAVTSAYGLRAIGCNTVLGTAPTNCYGAWFSRQDAGGVGKASTRNYSFASEGPGLMLYNSGLGASYLDWEDAAHVTRHAIYGDASNNFNIQAINAAGISLLDSGAVVRATLTSAGLKVATGFTPTTAAGIGLGTNALPFSNICLGTAATNNLCTNVSAMAAARTLNIPDPLGTVSMPYVIASGTSAMTTAAVAGGACGTTVTTAATGALTTDSIEVARNAAATAANGGLLALNWWVTAGNVNFNYCNGGTVSNTPTAMTINWRVIR